MKSPYSRRCGASVYGVAIYALALSLPAASEPAPPGGPQSSGTAAEASPKHPAVALAGSPKGYTTAFLQGGAQAADVRSLLVGGDILPGTYRVDLYVNTTPAGRRDVTFSENPRTGAVEPCISPEMLIQIGVDGGKMKVGNEKRADGECLRLSDLITEATAFYDVPRLRLNLSIPQSYLSPARRGYIDPEFWEDGVPAAFLDYSLTNRNDWASGNGGRNGTSTSVGMRMGANLGPWRLRNNSFLTSGKNQPTQFKSQNTYLQRGLSTIKSQLWLGETYTNSTLFDGVRFLGAQMASDESMYPDNEQGYAPVIRGNADSNATVEVRQNGYLIYTANVAPGPFEITDLAPSGSNGDLEVTVIEADGTRRVQRQAFSSPPLMVREGRVSYDAAIGQFRQDYTGGERPVFGSASALYGLSSNVTLAGGLRMAAGGYQAASLGVGVNTRFGALSLSGTHSISKVGGESQAGDRINLRYGKYLEDTNTHISVNAQRSLNDKFRSLSDHVYAKGVIDHASWYGSKYAYSKSRVDVYLTQNIGRDSRYGSLYVSGSDEAYWDDSKSRSLSLGYSNSLGPVSYSIGYTHSRNVSSPQYRDRYSDNVVSLTLSFPLGSGWKAPQAYTNLNRQNAGTSVQAGVTGQLPTEREINYGIAAGRGMDGTGSGSASVSTTTSFARLGAGYSYGNNYHSGTLSANGSLVVHGGGVNMGQSVGETFVLAKVDPPVSGVALSSYAGIETGSNGYAIVPGATPFRSNWVGLNTRELGGDIEFENAMQQVVPTRGAVGLATFAAETGRRVQFELTQADGSPMPFGAIVDDASGNRLGITDTRGRVLTMLGPNAERGSLVVRWSDRQCRADYSVAGKAKDENYQRVPVRCGESEIVKPDSSSKGGPVAAARSEVPKL